MLLRHVAASEQGWSVIALRYFNPVGAHPSGLIGEAPSASPTNLMPLVAKAALGDAECVKVFGGDYDTSDGSCVRDFIHVVDLAEGHVAALQHVQGFEGIKVFNLGTGVGHTVLNLINTYAQVSNRRISYEIVGRRLGDVPICFADPTLAKTELGWRASRSLREMCFDDWNWRQKLSDIS